MKVIVAGLFVFVLFASLEGCAKPELTVWSAYPEYRELFSAPEESYKKLKVNYQVPGTASSGETEPGLFILDKAALDSLIDSGLALDITGRYAASPAYYRNGGNYGIFLDSGTGVLCYDPELLERYLHVSEPALVQEQLGNLDSFIVAAFLIGQRSFGSCAVLPSAEELLPSFRHTKFSALQKAGLSAAATERWFADISALFRDRRWDGLETEDGKPRRAVTFFLAPQQRFSAPGKADWQVIRGPDPESNGGVWIALHRDLFTGKKRIVQRREEFLNLFFRSLEGEEAGELANPESGENPE